MHLNRLTYEELIQWEGGGMEILLNQGKFYKIYKFVEDC